MWCAHLETVIYILVEWFGFALLCSPTNLNGIEIVRGFCISCENKTATDAIQCGFANDLGKSAIRQKYCSTNSI